MTSKVAESFEMTEFLEKDVNNRESRGRFCFQFKGQFIKKQFIKKQFIKTCHRLQFCLVIFSLSDKQKTQ